MTEYRTYSVKYVEGLEAALQRIADGKQVTQFATRDQEIALAALVQQKSIHDPGVSPPVHVDEEDND